jgi:hypothetical protein
MGGVPCFGLPADKVIELLEARNWSSERIEGSVKDNGSTVQRITPSRTVAHLDSRKGSAPVYSFFRKGSQPRGTSCMVLPL